MTDTLKKAAEEAMAALGTGVKVSPSRGGGYTIHAPHELWTSLPEFEALMVLRALEVGARAKAEALSTLEDE